MKSVRLSLAALALGLSSCGGDSSTNNEAALITLRGLTSTQRLSLDGSFESACAEIVSGGGRFYIQISMKFINPTRREVDRFVRDENGTTDTRPYGIYVQNSFFTDITCSQELVRGENKGEFQFSEESEKLTIDSKSMSIAPMEKNTTLLFNREQMCDFSEWKTGMERNTIGTSCSSSSTENVFFINRLDDSEKLQSFEAFICDGNILKVGCSKVVFKQTT